MAHARQRKRWWRRRKADPPAPVTRVCPACRVVGVAQLRAGDVCASCAAQRAWAAAETAGVLVVDQASIADAVARRQGTRMSWWHHARVWVPAIFSLCAAAWAGWMLRAHLAPREIGPLRALLDDLHTTAQRAMWIGLGAALAGIILLVRTRRRAHFRRTPIIAAHALAIVAGATTLAVAGLSRQREYGGRYTSMPKPETLAVSPHVDRIVAATVVIIAPDREGNARAPAFGSGAIVGGDAARTWIVTCSHVAMPYAAVGAWRDPKTAQPVWVELSDGRGAKGLVRWAAPPPIDIAVVEVAIANPPPPVQLGTGSNLLEPGAGVMFVPNPYRDGWLVHRGQLLRKDSHRSPAGTYELLVTDLPLIPGDSGSGLFDARGQLVGLNTWVKIENGLSQGISLPTEAMAVLADAINQGNLDKLEQLQSIMKEH